MRPALFLRIASVLTLLHCALHTIGGVLGTPKHGTEEVAVIDTMKSHQFNFMGSMRSYWDFHLGYGLFVTINLLIQALLFWQLATFAKTNAAAWIRPILVRFFLNYIGMAIIAFKYFFIAPVVTELLIAACLALAFATTATSA
jgi:hypothetical protein